MPPKREVRWERFGEELLSYASTSEANGHVAGEIYRMVDEGAADGCEGWPRLEDHPGIFWWWIRGALIFVAFDNSGRLTVLEFQGQATRPADFDAAARRAVRQFEKI